MDRRDVLRMLGVAAIAARTDPARPGLGGSAAAQQPPQGPAGTPSDPDLLRPRIWWNTILTPGELTTLAALCDVIIPADDKSPSASAVGVPDFINEYASAPYEGQQNDLVRIRGGLLWLDTEAGKRFGKRFSDATPSEKAAICDDICWLPNAKPELREAAGFFDLIRDLAATGFYTTREGMKDLGYVGNTPLQRFDGPPPEVLKHLGLE